MPKGLAQRARNDPRRRKRGRGGKPEAPAAATETPEVCDCWTLERCPCRAVLPGEGTRESAVTNIFHGRSCRNALSEINLMEGGCQLTARTRRLSLRHRSPIVVSTTIKRVKRDQLDGGWLSADRPHSPSLTSSSIADRCV
ncbi:hypothetical protein J6590_074349 [Homalodisca vitripennis]|nr:hypothetical protein J6590_074349 [Homalodisca vitripennis]